MRSLNFHTLWVQTMAGQVIAAIAELANCQVEAYHCKEALVVIRELVSDRLDQVEVLLLQVSLTFLLLSHTPQVTITHWINYNPFSFCYRF
jgi:hypothetical protein